MSAVREEEELRREGADDFVAIEIAGRTPWQLFWVRFKRDRVAFAALGFIVLLVLVAILAGPITSAVAHPPNAQFPDALDPIYGTPTGPTSKFFFGVDQVGRDVFSRVLYGAQASLEVALIATAISEIARNITGYAGSGAIRVAVRTREGRRALVVRAEDDGPGISDVDRALEDGYSTGSGLGLGLPGARRLMVRARLRTCSGCSAGSAEGVSTTRAP